MTRLRDIMPKGFYARAMLIMFVPIISLMIGMTWFFFDGHLRTVNERLSNAIARDAALLVMTHDRDPAMTRARLDLISDIQTFDLAIAPDCPAPDDRQRIARAYPSITAAFASAFERAYRLSFTGSNRDVLACVESAGEALVFSFPRKRAVIINGHIYIVWVIGCGLLLLLTAFFFLRNQVRSILRLAAAARAYGLGRDADDFKPAGATEIRDAARAVIDMRNRLKAAAEQRTAMLAAVSHDLRTPLTRLKLELAMMEQTDDIRAARRDLDDMAMMLDEYLAFARGEEGESAEETALHDLLVEEAGRHGGGDRLGFGRLDAAVQSVRRMALRRAVSNLVSNALAHGSRAEVSLHRGPHASDIIVDDDGPGIPAGQREEALKPFARLDISRNQNTAGVGLGLALARDVAASHGGALFLEDSPLGGLRVVLRLPR